MATTTSRTVGADKTNAQAGKTGLAEGTASGDATQAAVKASDKSKRERREGRDRNIGPDLERPTAEGITQADAIDRDLRLAEESRQGVQPKQQPGQFHPGGVADPQV